MKINKAIIPAAGYGTRFLPVTKSVQKEMLPILQKPVIDYVVDDCLAAGITEIIFIVKDQDEQIRHYYSEDAYLKRYLERMKKMDKYDQVKDLHTKAKFVFVAQKESDPYGTGVPVKLAEAYVKDEEAFLVMMGDDFFYDPAIPSQAAKMIETFNNSGAQGLVTVLDVPKNLVGKYGIAKFREENGFRYLTEQLEKPQPEEIDSTLATISKYIFTPKIFKYFAGQQLDARSGEFYLTTTYTALAQDEKVVLHDPKSQYIDSGYLLGWLQANLTMAKNDPELWKQIVEFVNKNA